MPVKRYRRWELSGADIEIELLELEDPNDRTIVLTGNFVSTIAREMFSERLNARGPQE
jgi:hypothetical protein